MLVLVQWNRECSGHFFAERGDSLGAKCMDFSPGLATEMTTEFSRPRQSENLGPHVQKLLRIPRQQSIKTNVGPSELGALWAALALTSHPPGELLALDTLK